MNERIRELYLQASVDDSVDSEETMVEKFAEMLVRECAPFVGDLDSTAVKEFFNHFGVEE